MLAGQRRKLGLEALIDVSPADGIVTGVGAVNADRFAENRTQVALLAYDSTVMAGTQGFFGHLETDRMIEVARDQGLATVFFTEGYGGRPNDDDFAQTVQSGLKVTTFAEFTRLRGWGATDHGQFRLLLCRQRGAVRGGGYSDRHAQQLDRACGTSDDRSRRYRQL